MASVKQPADIIALLQDIERRSRQGVAGLSQQDHVENAWTAIGFRLGQNYFLIPLEHSREVFPVPMQITPVPLAQPWVYGVANLRGDLLPLVDLQHFLLGTQVKPGKSSRVMVLNHPDLYSGVIVDEVFGLKHFQQPPERFDQSEMEPMNAFLEGRLFQQNRHWYVFNFLKLAEDPSFINAAA